MDKTVLILAKLSFLKIPANAWDAINPQGPKVSIYLHEYLAAGLTRDVAALVMDQKIAANVMAIGKEMVRSAAGGMIQGWEEGDDICPPWPSLPGRGGSGPGMRRRNRSPFPGSPRLRNRWCSRTP